MILQVELQLTEEQVNYVTAAARIRGCSRRELLRRTLRTVMDDQLFLSVLDDGDRPRPKRGGGAPLINNPFSCLEGA